MKYLLDTSAIAVLLARFKEEALNLLRKQATLDLALYEFGNIIWKEHALFRRTTLKQALNKASKAYTILRCMKILSISRPEEYKETMLTASTLKITFYDSAFLTLSKLNNLKLVTQDKELLEKAPTIGAKAVTLEEFLNETKR